jgi:prepilin-type N-terminal cleavage/methylation domain-containing protein
MKNILMKNSKSAFTLTELAVVILIIGILFFGTISSSTVLNSIRRNITKDRMEIIYRSMGKFLADNKRLPCPASILLGKDNPNYGKEVRDSSTLECKGAGVYSSTQAGAENVVYGMVPTQEFGISADFAEDGFGNKINYYVDKRFTANFITNISNDLNLVVPSFGTSPAKDIILIKNQVLIGEVPVNNDAIIVFLSNGPNGYGAFKNNGVQNSIPEITQSFLLEYSNVVRDFTANQTANFDRVFFAGSNNNSSFDDIVYFKTRNDFVESFNLMSLIPCKGNDIFDSDFSNLGGKKSVYYGTEIQADNPCTMPHESIRKVKKCDSYGRWIDIIGKCPSSSSYLTCTIGSSGAGIEGMKPKTVKAGTSGIDGECLNGFEGSYSWSCTDSQVIAFVNKCLPFCSLTSALGSGIPNLKVPPNRQGEGQCASGYNGYFIWSCDESGVASINTNNCSN